MSALFRLFSRTCLFAFALATLVISPLRAQTTASVDSNDARPALSELLRTSLEGVDGKEVIVSRVVLPANTSLPRHWHPGEEFAYIIEGSVVLSLEDEGEIVLQKDEAGKVPLQEVHSARSENEGATILVFRVHESGQPERHLVE